MPCCQPAQTLTRHLSRPALGLLFWAMFAMGVLAHGAWLGGGGIALTDASRQQIQDNIAAGLPPLSVGDTVSVIADFPVIASGTIDGPGGYATLYVPPGTEVVGAYITDATGTPVPARPARASTGSGVSKGWGPKGQQTFDISANGWAPSETTQCDAAGYSIANCNAGLAYIYGDTGIFYSTRADTALFADGSPIATLENGYLVNPTNSTPWSSVGGSGTARVHNKWDAVQVNAFGSGGTIDPNGFSASEETSLTSGRGATPFRGGSPVAGPESGTDWDRYGVTGPWNRISYDGSCRADDPLLAGPDGPATGAGSVFPEALDPGVNTVEVCTQTTDGFALNDSSVISLPSGTNALRYAFGGIAAGETYYAVMDVRITDLAQLGYFNAEGHGGDSAEGAAAGNDNPWRYWVAGTSSISPAGPDDLHIDIAINAVNGAPYGGGDIPQGATVTYRVSYVNTSLSPMTTVATDVTLPVQVSGTGNFQVVTGADIRPATDPASGTFSLQTMPVLDGLGSGTIEFDAYVTATTGGSLTASASNTSDQGGADTDSVTTNVSATPVAAMPTCDGSRFSVVDWQTDAPATFGIASTFSGQGIGGQVLATDNSAALRPAQIGTTGAIYASTYGGTPVLTQQYATLDITFDTTVSAVQFYITSLDLDESVTVYGEHAGLRVQPAVADGPFSTPPMLRLANTDGSVLAERNSTFSNTTLAENSAVLVGFGSPVDRIVVSHTTRQFNNANFAGALQLTDIQACADFTDAPSVLGDALHARDPNGSHQLGAVVTGDTGPGNANDAGSDDDDGVEIPPLVQGFLATLEATVTGTDGLLSAWMDFNGNDVFEPGTAEAIAIDLSDDGLGADLTAGDGLIQFDVTVPGDAVLDQTFARFRWSTIGTIGVADAAPNGEVEDYAINIAAAPLVDRGDAPASYGDPLHIISDVAVAGTYLGAVSPDPEAAPQTSADATGDDLDGNDDEDGVIMPQLYAGGTAEISVIVNEVSDGVGTVTGGIAYLQAWIDFDGDGSFDAADQIASDLQDGSAGDKDGTLNGVIKFDVSVPSNAALSPTFARFRWSTTEGVVPVALDGEVEDYITTISNDDPPVTCDNGLYQIANDNSALKRMRFADGGGIYALTFDTLGTVNTRVDAGWGYNALDGYLYGVREGKRELWRVDGGGNFVELANFPGSAERGGFAGDILPDGTMVYQTDDTTWQMLDLADPDNPVDLGQLALSQQLPVEDFAAHPFDGFIYGINPNTGRAFRVSTNGGVAGPVAVIEFGDPVHIGTFAALFFDEDGRLYAYDNDARELYVINTTTGARQLLARSTSSEGGFNDGASCRGPAPVALSGFGGNIFNDLDASDIKDGAETNLGAGIRVDLYSDNGTPNNPNDDGSIIASVETLADGTYRFDGLPTGVTYRVEVDLTDPDLPPGAQIGTSNPLVGVTTDSGTVVIERDFGFDPQSSDLSITKRAFRAGTATEITTGAAGDLIDWVVEIRNDGPGSPSGVRVIERIPDGFDYISDTAPPSGDFYNPDTGLWFVDEILSGATETITIRVRMRDSGNFTNVAEVTESSLPDIDSDPAVGTLVDDYGDGIVDDDEASVTLTQETGTRRLAGRVILDTGAGGGTAHDGAATGGEVGTDAAQVELRDDLGTLIARPALDAAGRWSYALDASYAGEVTVTLIPDEGWLAISEDPGPAPAVTNADPHDGSYSFTPAPGTDHTGLNLGIIASPTLSEDRSINMTAGQIAVLPHIYRASSSGTVSFAHVDVTEPSPGAFSTAVFHDTDCDTVPDAPLTDPVSVIAGEEICVVSRVSSGGGVPQGSVLSYRLVATTTFTNTPVTDEQSDIDRITVGEGGGQLVMIKTVRNETRNTAEGQSNSAAPGDVLAYRITLINPSQANATDIVIYDRTPPYTELAEPIATPVVVSPALNCALAAPTGNVVGYAGPLQWDCTGFHAPGDEGSVIFKVQVAP
ncbi:MAG: GEVED domain-containing protein [Celeribacter sp.]|jgi:uncharacterized repeat protein (TIGR01451 family)